MIRVGIWVMIRVGILAKIRVGIVRLMREMVCELQRDGKPSGGKCNATQIMQRPREEIYFGLTLGISPVILEAL